MPDADGRLSRLTAKLLLRRSSSSSSSVAKNVPSEPPPPAPAPSAPTRDPNHHHNNNNNNNNNSDDNHDGNGQLPLENSSRGRRPSQLSQLSSLTAESLSSVAARVKARTPSATTSQQTVIPAPAPASAEKRRPEAKRLLAEQSGSGSGSGSIHSAADGFVLAPESDPSSDSSSPCPPAAVEAATAATASLPRSNAPPAAPTTASSHRPARKPTDIDAEVLSSADPSLADAPKTTSLPLPHRGVEDPSFAPAPSLAPKESPSHPPRLSRQSTRSVAAASTRSLNVVDEKAPDRFASPSPSQPPFSPSIAKAAPSPSPGPAPAPSRPSIAVRRQSLVPSSQQRLIKNLLDPAPSASSTGGGGGSDYFSRETTSLQPDMINRKIWVKRAGCSPTLVTVTEEDLVDDLREAILRKYGNSIGHTFDAPDLLLKLILREPSSKHSHQERTLGPEEPVGRTLDIYYPNGQTVDEALIIDIPQKRTPKPSPRHNVAFQDLRPSETGEYFPPMGMAPASNHAAGSVSPSSGHGSTHHGQPQSMSIISTGQLPPLPSPGNRGSWHQQQQHRPKNARHSTASPTMITAVPAAASSKNESINPPTNGVGPLPSPPVAKAPAAPQPPPPPPPPPPDPTAKPAVTPPVRAASPRLPRKQIAKLKMSSSASHTASALPAGLLDGSVPPINVLIVEDNSINLKLLEAFMKRLRVRWQTAMNGRDAVNKWRQGGFHLVLMDIQLPVLDGLQATREIRRLERLNGIGVYFKTVSGERSPTNAAGKALASSESNGVVSEEKVPAAADTLDKRSLFKSPVIIVALTASSLQSDRHEALAAGCNDFLTKPVNMMWLEQKVTEWGCMQALIDFEGWRKWRGFMDEEAKSSTQP